MLTKSDFSEIKKILREEIESESKSSKQEIKAEIKLFRMKLEDRLSAIENTGPRLGTVLRLLDTALQK